ncbi:MAG: hypothetical protein [Enterobacter phage ENC7]|nr:MAG: hypothetical protein [Enterobacter phage ENC7]UIW11895.1 MAG: hypothetical protein [Enterobacter phage ENC25]UIW12153.1 MAG: hypothetical protein [Enterobacter phage ENC22]URP85785.1 hypothetical protein ECW2_0107 [Enterobacter phage EC-W2]
MKKILVIVFLILLSLKLAAIGVMANASWWIVFSPLIVIGVIKLLFWVLFVVAMANVFPKLSLWIAKNAK